MFIRWVVSTFKDGYMETSYEVTRWITKKKAAFVWIEIKFDFRIRENSISYKVSLNFSSRKKMSKLSDFFFLENI